MHPRKAERERIGEKQACDQRHGGQADEPSQIPLAEVVAQETERVDQQGWNAARKRWRLGQKLAAASATVLPGGS